MDAAYRPHTITWLLVFIAVVIFYAFFSEKGSVASGLGVAACAFLTYCAVQVRDGLMYRPHPVFWRVVHGIGILYMCSLTYLLMQSPDDARKYV